MIKDHLVKLIGLFIIFIIGPLIIYLTDFFFVAIGVGIFGIIIFLLGLNIKEPKEMNN